MLTKIRERAADALLRRELLCGEADFRTLAEASASGVAAQPRDMQESASLSRAKDLPVRDLPRLAAAWTKA